MTSSYTGALRLSPVPINVIWTDETIKRQQKSAPCYFIEMLLKNDNTIIIVEGTVCGTYWTMYNWNSKLFSAFNYSTEILKCNCKIDFLFKATKVTEYHK